MIDETLITSLRRGVAVITGATGTLGRELAAELARLHLDLVLMGRNQKALEQLAVDLGDAGAGSATPLAWDLADSKRLTGLVDAVRQSAGQRPISLMVHCAGADHEARGEASLQRDLNINFHAPELLADMAHQDMQASGSGQIILLSSNLALLGETRGTGYSRGKAGLERIARAMIAQNRQRNIHILVVVPGLIDSPLFRAGLARRPAWQRHFLKPRQSAAELARQIVEDGMGRSGLMVMDSRHRILRWLAGIVPGRRTEHAWLSDKSR
ncbi:MAG: SDR family NAD(P)-dependent oxidoreductase [Alphaproteobacteria bacterium]|jgi:short-subunit dehydrogenase